MILLKLFSTSHLALNSDTITDTVTDIVPDIVTDTVTDTLDLNFCSNVEFKHAFDFVLLHTVDLCGTVCFSCTYS
jgi:hypothetical protein